MEQTILKKPKASDSPHCGCGTDRVEVHPDHKRVLNRLKRSEGQVRGISAMIEDNRYCVDILVQLRALIASIKAVEAEVLRGHLESCVKDAFQAKGPKQADVKLNELLDLIHRMT